MILGTLHIASECEDNEPGFMVISDGLVIKHFCMAGQKSSRIKHVIMISISKMIPLFNVIRGYQAIVTGSMELDVLMMIS